LFVFFCIVHAQIQWTNYFFDDFNRPNGNPGPNWVTGINDLPPLDITNGKLCSTTQSVALFNESMGDKIIRVTYSFVSTTNEGYETYTVGSPVITFPTPYSNILIIGCDGGGAQKCTPTIAMVNTTNKITAPPVAFSVEENYFFDTSVIYQTPTLNILGPDGSSLSKTSASLFLQNHLNYWGVLVGRSGVSCIDDFSLDIGSFP